MANGRLVFGVLASDGHVRPHPPIQRALNIVVSALRQCGREVIKWSPPPHLPAVEVLFKILGSISASEARPALKARGEPPISQLEDWYYHEDIEPSTSAEFWALCAQGRQFCADYKTYWNSMATMTQSGKIPDGVDMPVVPTLAVRPGEYRHYGYSATANALEYVSGVFPVTRADRSLDAAVANLVPLSELDNQIQSSCEFVLFFRIVSCHYRANVLLVNFRFARQCAWSACRPAGDGPALARRICPWPAWGNW